MGFDIGSDNCTEPTVIRANWVLSDNGKIAASGATSRRLLLGGGGEGDGFRSLGGAHLKEGHNYVLDVEFTEDGSILDVTHPHLAVVAIDDGFYEDALIGLFVFYFLPCASAVLIGLGILTFSGIRHHRRSKLV